MVSFFIVFSNDLFLPSLQPKVSEEDDCQDSDIKTACQDLVSPWESVQSFFVEEGKEWLGCNGQKIGENCQEGEGFTNLILVQELGHVGAGGCGDAVPQHVEQIAEVESPQLAEQGYADVADDDARYANHQDGGVSPL